MTGEVVPVKRAVSAFSLGVAVLFLISMPYSVAKGKSTLKIPKGFSGIVANGSLISLPSMEQTLGHKYEGPVREVHLIGYERVWTCIRPFNSPLAAAAGANKIEAYLLKIRCASLSIPNTIIGWLSCTNRKA